MIELSAAFSHVVAGYYAGLGTFGDSHNLITKEFTDPNQTGDGSLFVFSLKMTNTRTVPDFSLFHSYFHFCKGTAL